MNKKAKEILEKCIDIRYDESKQPLLGGIIIIQQRKLHDSGYRMMYVIGHDIKWEKYYLISKCSDVINFGNWLNEYMGISNYCKTLNLDISSYGIIHIWSNEQYMKPSFRMSSCIIEMVDKNENRV